MKNLKIFITKDKLEKEKNLRVSRNSSAYPIFMGEFPNLAQDMEGNLIVPLSLLEGRETEEQSMRRR